MAKKSPERTDDGTGKDEGIPVPRATYGHYHRVVRALEGHDGEAEATANLSEKVSRLTETVEKLARERSAPVRPTYTVKEAAQLLAKSTHTIRRWIREGKLQSTKTSDSQQGQHLIPHASLAPFLHGG